MGFFGRARELEQLTQAFVTGHALVCVVGPGGVGKTRLARELASRSKDALWVDLTAASSVGALTDQLAAALGVSGPADAQAVGAALDELGSQLVVLDNFEGLVPHALPTLEGWLEAAPESAWLVTSRQRLGVVDEVMLELGGLSLPADADLESSEALQLLLHHAERLGVKLPSGQLPFAAQLVLDLGGSPLAIELAASRLSVMNVRALLHRVRSDVSVLRRRGGADRHQSLDAAFASSWVSLTAEEQTALTLLTVFRGGFDAEAAEAVLSACLPEASALDMLQTLRDRSLVAAEAESARLDLAPTLRELARKQFSAEHHARAAAAHAAHYLERGEALRGEAQAGDAEASSWLRCERQNLLQVVERLRQQSRVSASDAELGLRALLLLAPGRQSGIPTWEYLSLIGPAVRATQGSGAKPALYARGLLLRGEALWRRDRADGALQDLVHALDMATTLGDPELEAQSARALAGTLSDRARGAEAMELYDRAARGFQELGYDAAAAEVAIARARCLADRPAACVDVERAAARLVACGDELGAAWALVELALLELHLGRHEAVERRLSAPQLASSQMHVHAELIRGRLLLDRGELGAALEHLQAAAAEARRRGLREPEALALGEAGVAAHAAQEAARAHVLLSDAVRLLGPHDGPERARFQLHLGWLEHAAGNTPAAQELWQRALPLLHGELGQAAEALRHGQAPSASTTDADARALLLCSRAQLSPAPPDDALVVGDQALWFRAPHGERVSLERRRPVARLLWCLAQARSSGAADVSRDDLIAAGWPDERILAGAAAHRVRVAMSTLRKLGLKAVLVTTEDGYALDPQVAIFLGN